MQTRQCVTCSFENNHDAQRCIVCQTSFAPESKKSAGPGFRDDLYPNRETKQEPNQWACPSCTFVNSNIQTSCGVCSAPSVKPEHQPDWTCSICRMSNAGREAKCGMCAHDKGSASVALYAPLPFKPLNAPRPHAEVKRPKDNKAPERIQYDWKNNDWECESCHFINIKATATCGLCNLSASKTSIRITDSHDDKIKLDIKALRQSALFPAAFITLMQKNAGKTDLETLSILAQISNLYEELVARTDETYTFALQRLKQILAFRKSHNGDMRALSQDLRAMLTQFNTKRHVGIYDRNVIADAKKLSQEIDKLTADERHIYLPLAFLMATNVDISKSPYFDARTGVIKEPTPAFDLTPLAKAILMYLQGHETVSIFNLEEFIRSYFNKYARRITDRVDNGFVRRRGNAAAAAAAARARAEALETNMTLMTYLGEELICILKGMRRRKLVQRLQHEEAVRVNILTRGPIIQSRIDVYELSHPEDAVQFRKMPPEEKRHILTAEVLLKEQGNGASYVTPQVFNDLVLNGLFQFSTSSEGCIRILPPDVILSSKDIAENPQLRQAGWVICRSGGFNGRVICMFIGGGQLSKNRDIRALICEYDEKLYSELFSTLAPKFKEGFAVTAKLGTTTNATADRSNTEAARAALTDLNVNRQSFPTAMLTPPNPIGFACGDMDGPFWDTVIISPNLRDTGFSHVSFTQKTCKTATIEMNHSGDVYAAGVLLNHKETGGKYQFILQRPKETGGEDSFQFSIVCSWNTPITSAHSKVGWLMRVLPMMSASERDSFVARFNQGYGSHQEEFKALVNDSQRAYSLPDIMGFANCNTYAMMTCVMYYCARIGRTFLLSLDMPIPFDVNAAQPHTLQKVSDRCRDVMAQIQSAHYQRYLDNVYSVQKNHLRGGRTPTYILNYISERHDEFRSRLATIVSLKDKIRKLKFLPEPSTFDVINLKESLQELHHCYEKAKAIKTELSPHIPLGLFDVENSDPSVFCGRIKPSEALLELAKIYDEWDLLSKLPDEKAVEALMLKAAITTSLDVPADIDQASTEGGDDMRMRYVRRHAGTGPGEEIKQVTENFLSTIRYDALLTREFTDWVLSEAKHRIYVQRAELMSLVETFGIFRGPGSIIASYAIGELANKNKDSHENVLEEFIPNSGPVGMILEYMDIEHIRKLR